MNNNIQYDTLQLFYTAELANIKLAEEQAKAHHFKQLLDMIESLLEVAEETGWFIDANNKYEVLSQLLKRKSITLEYIHKIPKGLLLLPHLEELNLIHFTMRQLPSFIGQMKNLKILRCQHGALEHLPHNIAHLEHLEMLILDDNVLEDLPENIGNLQQLKVLSLRNNQLLSLPESLGKIHTLEKLYLASNQLQKTLLPTVLKNRHKSNLVVVNTLRRLFKW